MRAKIVICDLCQQTTKEGEIVKESGVATQFIVGFQIEPARGVSDDPGGQDKHICIDCINAILYHYQVNKSGDN